jgi:hypothetical protein
MTPSTTLEGCSCCEEEVAAPQKQKHILPFATKEAMASGSQKINPQKSIAMRHLPCSSLISDLIAVGADCRVAPLKTSFEWLQMHKKTNEMAIPAMGVGARA